MIRKIDDKAILNFLPKLSSSRIGERSDFHSLLRKKLDESSPLERAAIEYLTRTLEKILSQETSEEGELFLPPPLPLDLRVPPKQPFQPSLIDPRSLPEVSENFQGRQDFEQAIEEAAEKYGVDRSLIRAVIGAESSGNALAVSPAGAQGLMQLMPGTAAELGVKNSFDPVQNVMAGTRYLRRLLDRYRGDVKLALAAYNWGMGNLETQPEAIPRETKKYIAKIENLYRRYSNGMPLNS